MESTALLNHIYRDLNKQDIQHVKKLLNQFSLNEESKIYLINYCVLHDYYTELEDFFDLLCLNETSELIPTYHLIRVSKKNHFYSIFKRFQLFNSLFFNKKVA